MKEVFKIGTATGHSMFDLPAKQQANGRSRGRAPSMKMNRLETAYSEQLEYRRFQREILWWRFDSMKLRLAKDTFYETDFVLMTADTMIEVHEVKGHWEDDARVKVKVAASMFPFKFVGVQRNGKDGWIFEEF